MNFFSVFTSVFTLVILIVPGYLLARFRMIPESGDFFPVKSGPVFHFLICFLLTFPRGKV